MNLSPRSLLHHQLRKPSQRQGDESSQHTLDAAESKEETRKVVASMHRITKARGTVSAPTTVTPLGGGANSPQPGVTDMCVERLARLG